MPTAQPTTTAIWCAPLSMADPHVCAPIDANGNLTSDGTKTYSWNAQNQLVEVKEGTTTIATFEYDGEGRRTEKAAGGLTRNFIYDAEDIVEERLSGSTTDTIRYYHGAGIDEPLARKNSSEVVTYYLADHLGSIVQETNASGTVTVEREYDPWGVLTLGASTAGYAFTGREWDAEIGLYFYRARYYRPDSGRFMSDDPFGFVDGPNVYAYVGSSPLARVDPFGLQYDSVTRSLMEAIRRGNVAEVRNILEVSKDVLTTEWRTAGREAIQKLETPARDLIRASLKRSKSYASELEEETFEALLKDGGQKASKMVKLIKEGGRLSEKVKSCFR